MQCLLVKILYIIGLFFISWEKNVEREISERNIRVHEVPTATTSKVICDRGEQIAKRLMFKCNQSFTMQLKKRGD